MSLSLPRLRRPQSRPVCVGWCVVGGKRRVPLPPQIVSASPGLFVLAGVWWEVSSVSLSLPRLCQPQSRPVCVGWCVVGGKRRVPLPPQIASAPVPACLCWLVCGGR